MRIMQQTEINETLEQLDAGDDIEVLYEIPNGDWRHIIGAFAESAAGFVTIFVGNDVSILRITTIVELKKVR